MRKVIVSVLTSLDGRFEGAGGDLSVMPFDDAFSPHNLALLEGADTMLLGRTGFDGFAAYWPGVQHDEAQPEVERAISRRNTAIEKLVVSDRPLADAGAWGRCGSSLARTRRPRSRGCGGATAATS